jgi:lipopolysaccharide export system permease protein
MKILDKYILKKYFTSFFFTIILLIPIAIAIDISEKMSKFLSHKDLTVYQIIKEHYLNFVIFYTNMFMPLALFIAIVMFVSKMAKNTEIIAITSGGISFPRFLRPFLLGSTIIFIIALYANHFVVPNANKVSEAFFRKYLTKNPKYNKTYVKNINLQLDDNGNYVYIKDFNIKNNTGSYFSFEHFEGKQLKYKLTARNIKFNDSTYELRNVKKRHVLQKNDIIEKIRKMDTILDFKPKDLIYIDYLAKEMNSIDLYKLIKKSEKRGIKNLNAYRVELYKRTSLPFSAFILSIIAVALTHRKKRGGTGINLAIGVSLLFIYVFFMKVTEVMGASATSNAFLLVWIPNILYSIIAIYLYYNAKK